MKSADSRQFYFRYFYFRHFYRSTFLLFDIFIVRHFYFRHFSFDIFIVRRFYRSTFLSFDIFIVRHFSFDIFTFDISWGNRVNASKTFSELGESRRWVSKSRRGYHNPPVALPLDQMWQNTTFFLLLTIHTFKIVMIFKKTCVMYSSFDWQLPIIWEIYTIENEINLIVLKNLQRTAKLLANIEYKMLLAVIGMEIIAPTHFESLLSFCCYRMSFMRKKINFHMYSRDRIKRKWIFLHMDDILEGQKRLLLFSSLMNVNTLLYVTLIGIKTICL
jgi:hypothetical protein